MGRWATAVVTAVAIGVVPACQVAEDGPWFEGDMAAVRAAAAERGTLVMIEFYTDWCSWCRRLNTDTFAKSEVRELLAGLVAVRVDAEKEGRELARQYGVDGYPTIVFTDASGEEVDRIVGFLPPERFVAEVVRIRAGDTFVACLEDLSRNPADSESIRRAVKGLLGRSDPESAIARVEAFHRASDDAQLGLCRSLMFEARSALMTSLYERAAKLYRRGWDGELMVPNTTGTRHLRELVGQPFGELPLAEQAAQLRAARRADAADVLAGIPLDEANPAQVATIADFAFRNGLYRPATEAYRQWLNGGRAELGADELNRAAWQLYLARTDLDLALDLARTAWDTNADPDVADTLGRLLYLRGETERALEFQRHAVDGAAAADRELYDRAEQLMSKGESLDDRPAFEDYP